MNQRFLRAIAVLALLSGCERPARDTDTQSVPDAVVSQAVEVEPADPTLEAVFDALPPCEGLPPDGRVDLAAGCADGGCADMDLEALDTAWGATVECTRSSSEATLIYCAWPTGQWARFPDLDQDGTPDDDEAAGHLYLDLPYDGATDDGLGPGASLSCFVDALGYPDTASAVDAGAGYAFRYLAWSHDRVAVYDVRGEGRASTLALAGLE